MPGILFNTCKACKYATLFLFNFCRFSLRFPFNLLLIFYNSQKQTFIFFFHFNYHFHFLLNFNQHTRDSHVHPHKCTRILSFRTFNLKTVLRILHVLCCSCVSFLVRIEKRIRLFIVCCKARNVTVRQLCKLANVCLSENITMSGYNRGATCSRC